MKYLFLFKIQNVTVRFMSVRFGEKINGAAAFDERIIKPA